MAEWIDPRNWTAAFLLFVACLLYEALRPIRDRYIVQRRYFDRIYRPPWRGKLFGEHYEGFDDFLAAKASFDRVESSMLVLDTAAQEAEHSLFVVPARSKTAAIARLKAGKAHDKHLLHQTPINDILKRRTFWEKELLEADKAEEACVSPPGETGPNPWS